MRLGRTTLVHFISQVGVSLAGFLATFVIARELGSEVLGTYAVVVALVFWLNIPTTAIGDAVTKRMSEGRAKRRYLGAGLLLNAVLGTVILVAMLLGRPLLNAFFDASVGTLATLVVVANVGFITAIAVLNGEKKVALSGGISVLDRSLRSLLQIGAVLAGFGLTALLLGHAVAFIVAAVVGFLAVSVRPTLPTLEDVESLLRFARYSWLGKLKGRTFGWMDTIVLAFFVDNSLIGIYEVSWNIASVFALVAVSVQTTLFPEFSELGISGDHERIRHYLDEGLVFTGVFIIPGLFGAAVLGERVLRIYRPEFTQGTLILVVLVVARTVAAYGEQFVSAINAIDRPDVAFRINTAFVVANMGLNVLLVWQFGWYGAAVATALSAGLVLALGYRALVGLIGRLSIPYDEVGRQVLAGVAMAGAVVAVEPFAPGGNYATVALVAFGAAVYVATLLVLSTRVRGKAVGLLG
jgi:O-antigen/teichoic acid export membrane protein